MDTGKKTSTSSTNVDDLLASVLVEKVKEEEEERRKEEEKKEEELLQDSSDIICGVCELGGDLICCDGRCLRSFHPGMCIYMHLLIRYTYIVIQYVNLFSISCNIHFIST